MFTKKILKEFVEDNYNQEYEETDISQKDRELLVHRRLIHQLHEQVQHTLMSGDIYRIGNSMAALMLQLLKMYAYFWMNPVPFFQDCMNLGKKKQSNTVVAEALKVRKQK